MEMLQAMAIIGIICGVTGQVASAPFTCPSPASRGFVYGSSCYDFVDREMTWSSAKRDCRNRGGRLVTVTGPDMQAWLASKAAEQFPGRQGVWLGLHDRIKEAYYLWDSYDGNDQVATYFNWMSGEPNDSLIGQDCVYMRRSYNWRWVDVECNLGTLREYSSICEFRGVAPFQPPATVVPTALPPPATTQSTAQLPATTQKPSSVYVPPVTTSTSTPSVSVKLLSTTGSTLYPSGSTANDSLDLDRHGGSFEEVYQAHYFGAAKEAEDENSVHIYVSILAVALITIGTVMLVFFLIRRRRRLDHLKDTFPEVAYHGERTQGMENPLYGVVGQHVGEPLLSAASAGAEVQGGTRSTLNTYVDLDLPSAGERFRHSDEYSKEYPVYAEPFQQEPSSGCAATSDPVTHLYEECGDATSGLLNDLSKDSCDPPAASLKDTEMALNVCIDTDSDKTECGGYETFTSQWAPYENVKKPGNGI